MSVTILQGSVFDMLPTLPANSIDAVCTSPPYWQLRSYLAAGHELKPHELGSEPTPKAFVDSLVRVFRLVRTVMAPHAVCFLNIGDTYTNGFGESNLEEWSASSANGKRGGGHTDKVARPKRKTPKGIPPGNLCLIPQRLALSLQQDGWIVRSVVAWTKPAPMPASLSGWAWRRCKVKEHERPKDNEASSNGNRYNDAYTRPGNLAQWSDCPGCDKCNQHGGYVLRRGSWRPTSSWEPLLMLAKSPKYYGDGEAVKTPPAEATVSRDQYTRILDDPDEQYAAKHDHETQCVSGANLRDVWRIAAEPMGLHLCPACRWIGELPERVRKQRICPKCGHKPLTSHYAAFPSELVHRCLASSTSSKGYCPACGVPWCRVIESTFIQTQNGVRSDAKGLNGLDGRGEWPRGRNDTETLAWLPSCNCIGAADMTPRPARVLDPFAGSGRTLLEARRMGLDAVGIELTPDYCAMIEHQLREEMPLFTT